MKLIDLELKDVGFIHGRDAIEIIKIDSERPYRITFEGVISTSLCSKCITNEEWFNMDFIFEHVCMFNIYYDELKGLCKISPAREAYLKFDTSNVIQEVEDSNIVAANEGKNGFHNLRHFLITTYDYIIEVVCSKFETKIYLE